VCGFFFFFVFVYVTSFSGLSIIRCSLTFIFKICLFTFTKPRTNKSMIRISTLYILILCIILRKYYRRQNTIKSFRLISLTLFADFWRPYLITNMFLLLIGLFSTVLIYEIVRKSDQFCPYYQRMYISKPMSSLVSCAEDCAIDKAICSRFVYDENQKECILYQAKPSTDDGLVYTSTGQRLFLSSHEGIY